MRGGGGIIRQQLYRHHLQYRNHRPNSCRELHAGNRGGRQQLHHDHLCDDDDRPDAGGVLHSRRGIIG
jgi:hypothetical protein